MITAHFTGGEYLEKLLTDNGKKQENKNRESVEFGDVQSPGLAFVGRRKMSYLLF